MTVAVTGATGFVGQAFLDAAEDAGMEVRALTRRAMRRRRGVEWQRGDLQNRTALAKLVQRAEAIVHIAGVVNAPDAAGFHAGNVEGTLRLIEAAISAGVPRIVYVSSLSAREPKLSAYSASKRKAERLIAASGLDWTIVRPPAIYGPRDREILELFKIASRWRVVPMPPQGRTSLIHVDDLARLLVELVPERESTSYKTYEPDDGRPNGWSHREFAKAIGKAVGRNVWAPHLPEQVLRAVAAMDTAIRGTGAKLTPDRVGYMVHRDWVVRRSASVPASLWRPMVPTEVGLMETAAWYRKQGWLRL